MTILSMLSNFHGWTVASTPFIFGLHLDTSLQDFMQGVGIFSVFSGGWIVMSETMEWLEKRRRCRRRLRPQAQIRSLSQIRLRSNILEAIAGIFLFLLGIVLIIVGSL